MQDSKYTMNAKDKDLWHRYITRFLSGKETIAPKYTFSEANSRKLDLHGHTVNDAWLRFKEFIDQQHKTGAKSVVVITGKSGQISREFREWCRLIPTIRNYEPLGTHNGPAGSYRVNFKSSRPKKQ